MGPDETGLVGYWPFFFGLTLDFSASRHPTAISASAWVTTDGPPPADRQQVPLAFQFAGKYAAQCLSPFPERFWSRPAWTPTDTLYLSASGHVVHGATRIIGAAIAGNTVSWQSAGNPSSAVINFKLGSQDWPKAPQMTPLFEGILLNPQPSSFRGLVQPERQLCGLVLSGGLGTIWNGGSGASGTQVTLGTEQRAQHFCVYGDDTVLFMATDQAVGIAGPVQAGSAVQLQPAGPDGPATQWSFPGDGTIRPKSNSALAIGVDPASPAQLTLVAVNPADAAQQWVSLSISQTVSNGDGSHLLTAAAGSPVRGAPAGRGDAQLWYVLSNALICAHGLQALTVSGAAVAGAALQMQRLAPGSASSFKVNGHGITHVESGLVVALDSTGAAILAAADPADSRAQWWVGDRPPAAAASPPRPMMRAAAGTPSPAVTYKIFIETASSVFAGTDDAVRIQLQGSFGVTNQVELSQSQTHDDPFERGQTDVFEVTLPNAGDLRNIWIEYADNGWFGFNGENWSVERITVFDPATRKMYLSADHDSRLRSVPHVTCLPLPVVISPGLDSQMWLGRAPAQIFNPGGILDHSWIEVREARTTYFDCAGGHDGPGGSKGPVGSCKLNDAVRMATGYSIDALHPYQQVYGHDDTSGVQTCGVRASGYRHWDGQCHQIANRLLYVCVPPKTIADAGFDVGGSGLSSLVFGPYGVGFDDWCRQHGFSRPGSSPAENFITSVVRDPAKSAVAIWLTTDAAAKVRSNPDQGATGGDVRAYFRALRDKAMLDTATLGRLMCLPEEKVLAELQP